jgi:hypothetical protein
MKTSLRALLFAAAALVAAPAFSAPQLLLPYDGPVAKSTARPKDFQTDGFRVKFNLPELKSLKPGEEVTFALPNGATYTIVFDLQQDHGNGISSWIGYVKGTKDKERVVITTGPGGSFGRIATPEGEFRLVPGEGHDWLMDMSAEEPFLPTIDLKDDTRMMPRPKSLVPDLYAPEFVEAIPGVNAVQSLSKATPSGVVVDLMIVYTNGLSANLGANLMTRLNNLVASANTAYADSEVGITLRLVGTQMVNYSDTVASSTALDAITPAFGGGGGVFANIETLRTTYGADMVAFLRNGNANGGDGIAWIAQGTIDASQAPYMYSVTTGCTASCDWVFIHELGHNMGNSHDRATAAWQNGGVPRPGSFSYSYGYYSCQGGPLALSCNAFGGLCGTQPECSTGAGGTNNFADIMAYFHQSTMRNIKFSNPSLTCRGYANILQPCGVVESAADSANAALSMNNNRAGLSALRGTAVPVGPVNPTVTLATSLTPANAGVPVTFTATVAGNNGSVAGNVNFLDGAAVIPGCAAVALGSGSATCTTAALAVGGHSITAQYTGNTNYNPRTSTAVAESILAVPAGSNNVAAASAGATALGSSVYGAGFPVSAVINNDRTGANWTNGGGWADGTVDAYPDWLEVDFLGSKTIDRVTVYTLQDNWQNPVEPTDTMTFTQYGVRDFTVQGWSGTAWVNLASVTGNNLVKRTVTFGTYTTTRIRVQFTNALAGVSRVTEIEAWTATPVAAGTSINAALATNGGVATASSSYSSGFPVAAVNNNERAGINWSNGGGWADGTIDSYPDWVQVMFNGSQTLDHVVVYTLQDSWQAPSEPTDVMTFGTYGIRDFTVQGWNGTAWVTLGTVTANNLVKRTVSFSAFTTDRIRVNVTNALSSLARITEIEAWTVSTTPPINVALATGGSVATASTTYGSGFPVAAVINNERAGANWTAGGGWADGTIDVYPDWVQVDFSGTKTITSVVVYTLQDNWQAPVEPTDSTTFTTYGIRDFTVQGWNGTAWVTLGTVSGNNLVKRTINFTAFSTPRIRINVTSALASVARITEIEAWGN